MVLKNRQNEENLNQAFTMHYIRVHFGLKVAPEENSQGAGLEMVYPVGRRNWFRKMFYISDLQMDQGAFSLTQGAVDEHWGVTQPER